MKINDLIEVLGDISKEYPEADVFISKDYVVEKAYSLFLMEIEGGVRFDFGDDSQKADGTGILISV